MWIDVDVRAIYGLGFTLIFVGVFIILISVVLLLLLGVREGKARGGGALIIGPIPIVFGTDRESIKGVLWLALALTALLMAFTIVLYLMLR